MKRILVLTSSDLRNPMRGTPLRIVAFIRELAKGPYRVTLVAKAEDNTELYTVLPMPAGNAFTRLWELKKIVERERIDWIFTPTDVDIKMVVLLKLLTKVRIAIDIHGVANEEAYYFGYINYITKVWRGWVLNLQLYFFDAIFVVSKKMAMYYKAHQARMSVVYGGVDGEVFPHCATYREPDSGPFEVTYMGNTRPYQGLPILIEALRSLTLPNLHLRLIMTGSQEEVTALLDRHGLRACTTIHTDIPHSEVVEFIKTSDVLVIPRPSLPMTEYAYPSKLPECVATGVPVVATDVGPVSELFTHKVHCIVTEGDGPSAFKAGIEHVANMSKDEKEHMGKMGREFVLTNLSWDTLGETIRTVFK